MPKVTLDQPMLRGMLSGRYQGGMVLEGGGDDVLTMRARDADHGEPGCVVVQMPMRV